ncbi:extracellular catalytic domain type 1 short-chain-length polyhydroxyalkanoate depolymerase [Granulosicoccus sp. 3-233]|uniref:extracellular catalytic domain type 1 short-chain-length polyhydroxyalkanoate depolymerase n=1 Tax=Granulosicoccus sp. 3-233 TaxID=3417969 RepID=UPI003D326115
MSKTPAELMQEATRLTLSGDAAGAATLIQEALSNQPLTTTDGGTGRQPGDAEPLARNRMRPPEKASGSFNDGVFSRHGAEMHYKLFVPARESLEPAPLLLLLHGCGQDPGSFATATRMNAIAEAAGMMVLYPAQSSSANPNRCWNWFEPAHQHRGGGEPDMLSELTRHVMDSLPIDPQRVFVAGFSAGAAMALVLAEQYPDLYSAAGVHSGLPTGEATSDREAFAMMMGNRVNGAASSPPADANSSVAATQPADSHTPLILFHGSQDRVVNVANAERIIANWLAREQSGNVPTNWLPLSLTHDTASGHHYVVTQYVAEENPDRIGCEYWQMSEGGHGWSGGNPGGSYTEQNGPDASTEIVRFFLERDTTGSS